MSTELTARQAKQLNEFAHRYATGPRSTARAFAGRTVADVLRDEGWTIEPPEPRYIVKESGDGTVLVNDTRHNIPVRQFSVKLEMEPRDDTLAAAQTEADRINNKDN